MEWATERKLLLLSILTNNNQSKVVGRITLFTKKKLKDNKTEFTRSFMSIIHVNLELIVDSSNLNSSRALKAHIKEFQ